MIRGTRRPGGAGRSTGRIKGGKGVKGGGGSKKPGCWPLALVIAGSGLMLTSGAAGLALVMVTK